MCLKSLRFMHMPNRSPKVRFGTEALAKCPPCSCGAGADGGPERHEPGCDRALEPHVGYDTWSLIGVALNCLLGSRGGSPADPRAELSCLASLLAEAQSRVPDAVTDALEQGYSWPEVASRLAVAPSTARRRYSDYAYWRALLGFPEEG